MDAPQLCRYCLTLPENDPAKSSHVLHCPLCHAELGVTATGAHFRPRPAAPPRPRRWPIVLAVVVCASASLAVAAWPRIDPPSPSLIGLVPPPPEPITPPPPSTPPTAEPVV